MTSPFKIIKRAVAAGLLLALCVGRAGADENSPLFSRATMTGFELNGVKVWLGQPRQITAQRAWAEGGTGPDGSKIGWAFAHPIPSLYRFPDGTLLVTYSMNPDSQELPQFVSSFQVSRDGGLSWERRYNVILLHNPMTFIPKGPSSMLGLSAEVMPLVPGDRRNFVAPTYLFENGGERVTIVTDGMRVLNWGSPREIHPSIAPEEDQHVSLSIYGNGVQVGRRFLATAMTFKRRPDGRRMFSNLLISSEDGGSTWRYFSTMAHYQPALGTEDGYEGPNESYLVDLPNHELMTIYRVGNGMPKWKLRRIFSQNGGRTWSEPEVLPAYSVKPAVVLLANGLVALTTGRPGIDLWLADGPHGNSWQRVDLLAHHNSWAPDSSYRILSNPTANGRSWNKSSTTTSYTSMVQVSPNRLLITYDRCPADRGPTGPGDLSRVFFVPVEIQRKP